MPGFGGGDSVWSGGADYHQTEHMQQTNNEEFKRWFIETADWQLAKARWPKECFISGKRIWPGQEVYEGWAEGIRLDSRGNILVRIHRHYATIEALTY